MALRRHSAAGLCLEAIGQLEELGGKMIDGEPRIFERAALSRRIADIVEHGIHSPGDIKAARRADGADGVKPVGVLQDFRFERFRRQIGGEAVRGDRVSDGGDIAFGPSHVSKKTGSLLGGELGSLRAQRRVLLDRHAIMQQHGGGQDFAMPSLLGHDAHGVTKHPQNMGDVVRTVIAFASKRDELPGKGLMRGEGGRKLQVFWHSHHSTQ